MADGELRFRFKPRYRGMAWSAIGIGVVLSAVSFGIFVSPLFPLITGAAGVVLGGGYLMSPTWKLEIVVDNQGYEVRTPKQTKFRVAWSEVTRVVASPSTHSCFVDVGAPERNLLVPGVGAPAPYDIENRPALFAAILEHVDPSKVNTVESLDVRR